ncbi:unnamed protein product [Lactuca virosa]|uniref:DUF2921 domain-containing protein n=1 Tax=Lactuca virosa TaxID=75947 RepID=A0AAU9P3E1_9ASTR|nr:unnamed protein product [Lactuca virosa]
MNPSLFPSNSFVTIFILTFILIPSVFSSIQTISYSDHCNSFAPEAIPTTTIFTRYPFLEPVTSHYTGGQNILGLDSPSQRSIFFTPTSNFRTKTFNTYKIQAELSFISSNIYRFHSNNSQFYHPLVFHLDGFWSVSTNKLCMVGSARWFSKKGNPLILNAVLKLNFARFINLNNSLVSGILESLASVHDSNYFEPIWIIGFPRVAQFRYNYLLVSNEECNGQNGNFSQQHSVASMQSLDLCSIFTNQFKTYKLENQDSGYPLSFPSSSSFLSLYAIQCSLQEKKLRFLVEFQDRRNSRYDQSFNPNITLIGDGTWNGTNNELCIVACRILNQTDPLESAHVGDCSVRLTVWFPGIRSIKNTHATEGQIWSTKKAGDEGYFEMVKFQSFDHSLENYGSKYEFTEWGKIGRFCPRRNYFKKEGTYPSGYDGDMSFDMSVKYRNMDSMGSAIPSFVGDHPRTMPGESPSAAIRYISTLNIGYEITFGMFVNSTSESGIPLLSSNGRVEISAEGVYDGETGRLCMIGCRSLQSFGKNSSFDCEIVVRFQFPKKKDVLALLTSVVRLVLSPHDLSPIPSPSKTFLPIAIFRRCHPPQCHLRPSPHSLAPSSAVSTSELRRLFRMLMVLKCAQDLCHRVGLGLKIIKDRDDYFLIHYREIQRHLG